MMMIAACGTCSSTFGQLASYPLALIRTRLQARCEKRYTIHWCPLTHCTQAQPITKNTIALKCIKICFLNIVRSFPIEIVQRNEKLELDEGRIDDDVELVSPCSNLGWSDPTGHDERPVEVHSEERRIDRIVPRNHTQFHEGSFLEQWSTHLLHDLRNPMTLGHG